MERREFLKAVSAVPVAMTFPELGESAKTFACIGSSVSTLARGSVLPPPFWSPQILAALHWETLIAKHQAFLAEKARPKPTDLEILGHFEPARVLTGEFDAARALRPGTLTVIAGRRAFGATTLALSVIKEFVWDAAIPAAFFTTDLNRSQALERILCKALCLDVDKMRVGLPSEPEFKRMASVLKTKVLPLYAHDDPNNSVEKIVVMSKALKEAVPDLGLIVVDELHRTAISSEKCLPAELRQLAVDLQVPVILVSRIYGMLNDELSVRPRLSLLENVEGLMDNAEVIALIWRDLLGEQPPSGEWWWRRFEVAFHDLRTRTLRGSAFRYYGASGRFGVWR
jgi:hypothetical protein